MGSMPYTGGWTATGNTLIGQGFYSGGPVDFVDGSIDDVEMFSSALSAAQVVALDQPAAYSFDDGTGTTAADVSGHGNTLTLGSGATWAAGRIGSNSLAVNGTVNGTRPNPAPVINTAHVVLGLRMGESELSQRISDLRLDRRVDNIRVLSPIARRYREVRFHPPCLRQRQPRRRTTPTRPPPRRRGSGTTWSA